MRIVIDTNIALDALLGRQPFNEAAERIMTSCVKQHKGYLTMNSLTDIFYILQRNMDTIMAKESIRKLMMLFEIISVNRSDGLNALSLPIDDFEDALILICAEKVSADCIVTRDAEFIKTKSVLPIISPLELLKKL